MNPLYPLIDIGANLTNSSFNNFELESIIDSAKEAGLQKIMITGTSLNDSREALKLARLYPGFLYFTAGIHPYEASSFTEESLADLEELAKQPECVAIGETGLDFHSRNLSTQSAQLKAFEAQVGLACQLGKSLFVHEREANSALLQILTKFEPNLPPVVIHCFTGTVEEAKDYLDRGYYIGLTGFLWKDRQQNGVQQALRTNVIPLDRLMLESDSPFMYPNVKTNNLSKEIRDKITDQSRSFLNRYCSFRRNHPCALPVICELVAALMDIPADQVALQTTCNAMKVFGLSQ